MPVGSRIRGERTPRTAGLEWLSPKLTGIPSVTKLDVSPRSFRPSCTFAARRSLRMREINRMSIEKAPVIHITPTITAVRPCVMSHTGSPIAASGLAHVRCGAQSLSMSAPDGTMKLNAVATQIQYLVVALARRNDVSTHAAEATIEANSRGTLKKYMARPLC